jgi:hypothetical protein
MWQSTALGVLPGTVQTGLALWSCTSVPMKSKVVTCSHRVTWPALKCRVAPQASQDALAFIKVAFHQVQKQQPLVSFGCSAARFFCLRLFVTVLGLFSAKVQMSTLAGCACSGACSHLEFCTDPSHRQGIHHSHTMHASSCALVELVPLIVLECARIASDLRT